LKLSPKFTTPLWAIASPPLSCALLAASHLWHGEVHIFTILAALFFLSSVFTAVYHAEILASRIGEPIGALVLGLAMTSIEVALITTVLLNSPDPATTVPRDTIFSSLMLILNGLVGVSLLLGGSLHDEQEFHSLGANSALAVLTALVTLTLILPNFDTGAPGPLYTTAHLAFAAAVSLILYCIFLFVQNVKHRDYFLPPAGEGHGGAGHIPSTGAALGSLALLIISLVAVAGLAESLTPALEHGVAAAGLPQSVLGLIIAALVLLPEAMAAIRAALANQLQTSINLALGSALASAGLTIPAIATVAIIMHRPLLLGLNANDGVFLTLTMVISLMTLGNGRTTILQGAVHLVIAATFVFFAVHP